MKNSYAKRAASFLITKEELELFNFRPNGDIIPTEWVDYITTFKENTPPISLAIFLKIYNISRPFYTQDASGTKTYLSAYKDGKIPLPINLLAKKLNKDPKTIKKALDFLANDLSLIKYHLTKDDNNNIITCLSIDLDVLKSITEGYRDIDTVTNPRNELITNDLKNKGGYGKNSCGGMGKIPMPITNINTNNLSFTTFKKEKKKSAQASSASLPNPSASLASLIPKEISCISLAQLNDLIANNDLLELINYLEQASLEINMKTSLNQILRVFKDLLYFYSEIGNKGDKILEDLKKSGIFVGMDRLIDRWIYSYYSGNYTKHNTIQGFWLMFNQWAFNPKTIKALYKDFKILEKAKQKKTSGYFSKI